MPKFIVQFQGQESVAELKPGANSVGRQSSNTIPLKDSTLSRLHCEVILAGNVATLLDKGSRNGTLLNGKKVEAQVLQPGDKIQIGATTLWYEKKNVAAEAAKPATGSVAPAPSTRRATAQTDTGVRKAQSDTGVRKAQSDSGLRKAQGAPSPLAGAAQGPMKDYAYHGKAGGHAGKIVAGVLVLGLLVTGGVFAQKFLSRTVVVVDDSENLVSRNAHFELAAGGKPDGWAMRPALSGEKSNCAASVDGSHGRSGGSCLMLEKGAGGGDLVAECGFQDDLGLAKGASISVSAWVQFDSFPGAAAVKIDWLKSSKGAVLAEEYSDPVSRVPAPAWTEIKGSFNPPAGAGAFRVALAIVGRGGRIYFDDVTVKAQAGAPAPVEKKIGVHKVSTVRSGISMIEMRGGRRSLSNISLRLESEKEGQTPQAWSTDVAVTSEEGGLSVLGKMASPVDFRDLVFEERIGTIDGLTTVVYQFRGDALKQLDRVTIALTVPRVDGPPRGLSESGDPTSRITFGSEDGDFSIEYPQDPARVKHRVVDGRLRIYQTWVVDPAAEDPAFVLRLRESGVGPQNPEVALVDLKAARKYGEALALARDQAKKIKEAPVREKFEAEIKSLEENERRDWAEAQALAFQARISRRSELVTKALASLESYAKQWAGEGAETKADALRRDFEKDLASTPAAETERPRRVFDRAKKYIEGGKRAMAQSLLQTLVARYPSSDVAMEAQQLLKSLAE